MIKHAFASVAVAILFSGCFGGGLEAADSGWRPHSLCPKHPVWNPEPTDSFEKAWLHARQGNWKTEDRALIGATALWAPSDIGTTERLPNLWVFSATTYERSLGGPGWSVQVRVMDALDRGSWTSAGIWKSQPKEIDSNNVSMPAQALQWLDDASENMDSQCAILGLNLVFWREELVWSASVFNRVDGTAQTSFWSGVNGTQLPNQEYQGITFRDANKILLEAYPEFDWEKGRHGLVEAQGAEALFPATRLDASFLGWGSIPTPADAIPQDGRSQSWEFMFQRMPREIPKHVIISADGGIFELMPPLMSCFGPCEFRHGNKIPPQPIDSPSAVKIANNEQDVPPRIVLYVLLGGLFADSESSWTITDAQQGNEHVPSHGS